nr:EOG090X0FYD [Eurycercus lamellatus]
MHIMSQKILYNFIKFSPADKEEMASVDKEQLLQHWSKQEIYINWIETQLSAAQSASSQVRDLEEKLRQSLSSESVRRESILLMRLNSKEQEMQDLLVQIQELKASQAANAVSLRSSLLDPAVNLLIQHLRKELEKAKSSLEETQNELSAWKFTPDSNTGKRLMAKCRLLYQENEELGRMISSGRLAKLEGDLALQRNFSEEMKKSQSELDEFLLELDEDVEGMQSTIYFLQQQLRQTREQLVAVQKENERGTEPDSNQSDNGRYVERGGKRIKGEIGSDTVTEEPEERVGEADTTGNNEGVEDRSDVVVLQAVADEGLNARCPEPLETLRTNNQSGERSPDDGVVDDCRLMDRATEPSRTERAQNDDNHDMLYHRADSGVNRNAPGSHHRSSETGDLVSGSGMEDESDCRTSSGCLVNGELRNGSFNATGTLRSLGEVSTSDESLRQPESETATTGGGGEEVSATATSAVLEGVGSVSEDDKANSAKCRKRTANEADFDATTSFRSSVICRPNSQVVTESDENPESDISSLTSKRIRAEPDSENVFNGKEDTDQDN